MRARTATALLLSLALAGCRAEAEEPLPPAAQVTTPTPTQTPPAPTPTPPPATPTESYEVPAVIDEAYVERVLNALYRVEGDALRLMLEAGTMTPEAERLLQSLYAEDYLPPVVDAYQTEAAAGFVNVRRPSGDTTFDVHEVISATPTCIFASGLRNFSATAGEPPDRTGEEDFVWLSPSQPQQAGNPTPWKIELQLYRTDGLPEEDRCAQQ